LLGLSVQHEWPKCRKKSVGSDYLGAILDGSAFVIVQPVAAITLAASSVCAGSGVASKGAGTVRALSFSTPVVENQSGSLISDSFRPRGQQLCRHRVPSKSSIKLDGEYEENSGQTETFPRKIKEKDKIIAPNFPSVTNSRQMAQRLSPFACAGQR